MEIFFLHDAGFVFGSVWTKSGAIVKIIPATECSPVNSTTICHSIMVIIPAAAKNCYVCVLIQRARQNCSKPEGGEGGSACTSLACVINYKSL